MSATRRHVGIRQWLVLQCLAEHTPGWTILKTALDALAGRMDSRHRMDVAAVLYARGLIAHGCVPADHGMTPKCLVAPTEAGLDAQLDANGRTAISARR